MIANRENKSIANFFSKSAKKIGVAYLRVDSYDDTDELKRQDSIIQKYAEKNNIGIIDIFMDADSGNSWNNRGELKNALRSIHFNDYKDNISFFLVVDKEIISENQKMLYQVFDFLEKYKINIVSVKEGINESKNILENYISTMFNKNRKTEMAEVGG